MARLWDFAIHEWWKVVVPLGVFTLCLGGGFLFRRLLFRTVRRWSAANNNHIDVLITGTLRGPMMIWSLMLGLDMAMRSSEVPQRYVHGTDLVLLALWIISLTIMCSQLAGSLVRFYGNRVAGDAPSTSLTKNLAQLVVVLIGFLILLNHLGVDIRPLLTALGVGGLAVALALQDTLSNLFSGFYITVAGQIRMGHYIKLNTGEEGYITDITWRSTTLRTQSNNFIIVPNAKLAQAIVTNYNLPEKRIGISVTVGVAYGSDPARVQAILVEEAIAGAATIEGLLAEPPPGAVLSPGFGDFALQFTLGVNVSDFSDQARVQSELRARILKRFALEGIEMPYPTQTLLLKQLPS